MTACAEKRTLRSAKDALRARDGLADPYVTIYWCEPCKGLHLGHEAWARSYKTWGAALQAVRDVQARQGKPRRMRVWKVGSRWHVGWALSARRPARRPDHRPRPLTTSLADAFAAARPLRSVS